MKQISIMLLCFSGIILASCSGEQGDIVSQQETQIVVQEDALETSIPETGSLEQQTQLSGVYTSYDVSLVGNSDTTVIFFGADWCPGCVAADKTLSQEFIPENITVLKADFDTDLELRKQYGVVAQHTFVQIDAEGNEVKKWVGGYNIADVLERVE